MTPAEIAARSESERTVAPDDVLVEALTADQRASMFIEWCALKGFGIQGWPTGAHQELAAHINDAQLGITPAIERRTLERAEAVVCGQCGDAIRELMVACGQKATGPSQDERRGIERAAVLEVENERLRGLIEIAANTLEDIAECTWDKRQPDACRAACDHASELAMYYEELRAALAPTDAQPARDAGRVEAITLTPAEIQSGLSRVKWAEGLILQLPETHDGRNSWLLNYGVGSESTAIRARWLQNNPGRSLVGNAATLACAEVQP